MSVEPIIKSYPLEDLKEMLQIADRDLCPECKREASEPCPCFEEEREQ